MMVLRLSNFLKQDLKEEAQEKTATMEKAKSLAETIKELTNNDPTMVKDVDEKMAKVEPPLKEVVEMLNARQAELQSVLLQSQDLKDKVDELNRWLTSADNLLGVQGPVSARYKILLVQEEKLKVGQHIWFSRITNNHNNFYCLCLLYS